MKSFLACASLLVAAPFAAAQVRPYTVVDLEPGVMSLVPAKPYSVSDDGKTLAGTRGSQGFVWRDGSGFEWLAPLTGDAANAAVGVDSAGNAGGTSIGATTQAVRYLPGGIVAPLGTLDGTSSTAFAVSRAGAIVGDAQDASGIARAFRWSAAAGMQQLFASASESHARDVSAFEVVAGYTGLGLGSHRAFRWSATGGHVDLGVPAGYQSSRGFGINAAGQVCGNANNAQGTVQAWVRHSPATGWQYLLTNAGKANTAWKLNDFGQVVGETHQDSGGLHRAAIYVDGIGIQDLNQLIDPAAGWLLRAAFDINERGQIVGWGEHEGAWRGFRLDPTWFSTYGAGCFGGGGHRPALAGFGAPNPGATIALMMAEGVPGGAGWLFLAATTGSAPTAGCTFLLGPPVGFPIAFTFDANRQARLVGTLPANLPSGTSVYFQFASLDPAAPNHAFALSNGLELIFP
jgi:probable HAF family extracellular repeat protein